MLIVVTMLGTEPPACDPEAVIASHPARVNGRSTWNYLVSVHSSADVPILSRYPACLGTTIQRDGWFPDENGGGIVITDRGRRWEMVDQDPTTG